MATPLPVFLAQLSAANAILPGIVGRITLKAGDRIQTEAKKRAPFLTGSLMRSIKNQGIKATPGMVTVTVSAGGPSSPHEVGYAVYVEKGTSRMGPQPYMRPATNKVLPQWEKELADVLELLASGKPGRVSGSLRR